MTREEMRYKLNELRMMLNDGEHTEEQGILVDIIKELDEAENKGEWIPVLHPWADPQIFCCTCCGRHIEVSQYEVSTLTMRYPFCHCGADMRGE